MNKFIGFTTPEAFEQFLMPYAREIATRILESKYTFVGDSIYWSTFLESINEVYFMNSAVIDFYGRDILTNEVKISFFQSTFMPLSRLVLATIIARKLVEADLFDDIQAQLYIDATFSLWYSDNNQSPVLCHIKGNFKTSDGWLVDHSDEHSDESYASKKLYYLNKLIHLIRLRDSFRGDTHTISLIELWIKTIRNGFVLWRYFVNYKREDRFKNSPSGVYASEALWKLLKERLFDGCQTSWDHLFQTENTLTTVQQEIAAVDRLIDDVLATNHYVFSHVLSHQFIEIAEIPMRIGIDLDDDEFIDDFSGYENYVKEGLLHIRDNE